MTGNVTVSGDIFFSDCPTQRYLDPVARCFLRPRSKLLIGINNLLMLINNESGHAKGLLATGKNDRNLEKKPVYDRGSEEWLSVSADFAGTRSDSVCHVLACEVGFSAPGRFSATRPRASLRYARRVEKSGLRSLGPSCPPGKSGFGSCNDLLTYFILVYAALLKRMHTYLARKAAEMESVERLLDGTTLRWGLNERQLAALEHALKHPGAVFTIGGHQKSHDTSYQTARTDLLRLSDELQILTRRKRGNAFVFVSPLSLKKALERFKV